MGGERPTFRTKSGRVLTDADFEALADEAEGGYDVSELRGFPLRLLGHEHLPVLDHGYVRYVDHMGSDLSVVNAARASFEKEESAELSDRDKGLLQYLARRNEGSPFRHAVLTLEVRAPLMVARQWWKYVVGSDHTTDAWNESSRRYVTEEPVYYLPGGGAWRLAPESAKQGSGDLLSRRLGSRWSQRLLERYAQSVADYEEALAAGLAPEQARVFLHAYALYVRWRWTASLQSVLHFLDERLAEGAQTEIGEYARAVEVIARRLFPESTGAWVGRAT